MINGWDMTGWGWVWMTVMMTVFILLIGLLILAFFRSSSIGPRSSDTSDPVEILAQRFARGEIDEEEYQSRRRVLQIRNGAETG